MPNVAVPSWYFLKRVQSDYANWREALAREFFQNSKDAGATEFRMGRWGSNGLYVYDNGCGMDRDVLLNKLLVLGEGQKAKGSVGGFGLAKELLFFSWPDWTIFTNDLFVGGASGTYGIPKVWEQVDPDFLHQVDNLGFNLPLATGTLILIELPEDIEAIRLLEHAYRYLQECETKVACYIDNHPVITTIKKGRRVRDLEWGSIHHRKGRDNHVAIVRASGVKMFERQVGSGLGEIVVEITGKSIEVLTSNRDGLTGKYEKEFDEFLSEISRDRRSALKDRKAHHYFKLDGTGDINLTPQVSENTEQFTAASKMASEAIDVKRALQEIKKTTPLVYNQYKSTREKDDTLKDVVRKIEFLGYNPSFWVKYKGNSTPPTWVNAFLKKRKARFFAHLWTVILKQVMLDNDLYLRFVAGFTFDDEEEAEYSKLEGRHVFLLNPRNNISSKRWQLVWQELRERAIHELAHRRFPYHDEEFVIEMDRLRRNCWVNESAYKKLYFDTRQRFPTQRASQKGS